MASKVKNIDQNVKDFVYGYIRNEQKLFPDNFYYTIPSLVTHWILLYYFINEHFDEKCCP